MAVDMAKGNQVPSRSPVVRSMNCFQVCLAESQRALLTVQCTVCLIAYNKEEIKQYGCCMLKVNYSGKTMVLPFYIVNSKFKPIISLDASYKLGLLTINCPIHQSWTSHSPTNTSFDTVSPDAHLETPGGNVPDTLTKEWIVGHPKYKHLFN